MAIPKTLPVLAACLGLGACSMLPGNTDGDAAAPTDRGESTPAFIETLGTPALTVGLDAPGGEFRKVDQFTRYARVNCNISSKREAGVETIVERLRDQAAAADADYLRVLGTGPLYNRGICNERQLQLSGAIYRRDQMPAGTAATGSGGSAAPAATDSLSSRLEELEGLRDRGLLNQNEYEQLRERVLDEAY